MHLEAKRLTTKNRASKMFCSPVTSPNFVGDLFTRAGPQHHELSSFEEFPK
jgi:hypothetical protein